MANTKISGLNAKTSLANTDLMVLVDEIASPIETKKITIANLKLALFASPTLTGTVSLTTGAVLNNNTILQSKDSGGTARNLLFMTGSNETWYINDAAGTLAFLTDSNAGAGNPAYRLQISGNIATAVATWSATTQTWSSYGAGALTTDGSGNITAVSDERLKDIQGDFSRGLKELLQLQPILYKWNKASKLDTENVYAGFSAQNVMKYIPEAVGTDPEGHYTFNDRPVVASLVNAVKELQEEIDELRDNAGLPVKVKVAEQYLAEEGIIRYVAKPVNEIEEIKEQ